MPAYAPGDTVQCKFCQRQFRAPPPAAPAMAAPGVSAVASGPDPLPGLVIEGSWQTIRAGHEIVPLLGRDRWLDWQPGNGEFTVWQYDRSVGHGDPLPYDVAKGSWESIRGSHQLISLGGDHLLDWDASTGGYRVWQYDPNATGSQDILPTALAEGRWQSIVGPARLIYLGGDSLLEWNPSTGAYRVWHYDRSCSGDPLPGAPIAEGGWESIRTGHELVYTGEQLLDWVPSAGSFRVFNYDRGARGDGDPFPNELSSGSWESIRDGHRLIYLEGDRVLDWDTRSGGYRIWTYGR